MNAPERILVTLFADVAGSTGLYQNHGDRLALAAIDGCLAVLKDVTLAFKGRVIKTIGDELMATFDNADSAFHAGCEMQWRTSDLAPLGNDRLAVRIGFHLGPAIEQDKDVFGDSVNIAARLAALARAGQIITSGRTIEGLDAPLVAQCRNLARLRLRGTGSDEDIHEVLWNAGDNVTTLMSGTLAQINAPTRIVLTYAGQRIDIGPRRPHATLGRDDSNDIPITSRRASRVHARVEWRSDKFVLIDQSTNGTHVVTEGGAQTLLRMEEMILTGRGRVSFGGPVEPGSDDVLTFSCEHGTARLQPQHPRPALAAAKG